MASNDHRVQIVQLFWTLCTWSFQSTFRKGFIMTRTFRSLAIVSSTLIIVACGGGGGGSGEGGAGAPTSDTSNTTVARLLSSEFEDPSNWIAYETIDQLESEENAIYGALSPSAKALSMPLNRKQMVTTTANGLVSEVEALSTPLNRDQIVTYTANGLLSEFFEYLVANNEGIAMGSRDYGVSVMKFADMDSPKGSVFNYRKDRLEGLAAYQNKFYAWFYDGRIVDIASGVAVYGSAPLGTGSIFSTVPKNRFLIDNGNFYIGTSNLEPDGSLIAGMDNGFWEINATLSSKTKLINHPVWCVDKDSDGIIWVGTQNGIYKKDGDTIEHVFNGYAEQIIEFNNHVYALIKDFFNRPDDDNDFDLYRWNETTFEYVCEVSDVYGAPSIFEMQAFEWESRLYVSVRGAQDRLLVFNDNSNSFSVQTNPIYNGKIGQQCATVADGKLFTVGNLTGLNIWDGNQYGQLNTVNTAEALISNAIRVLYIADDGNLWIGPFASGFNILDDEGHFDLIELAEETKIAGFFEKNGFTYVQGAGALYEVNDSTIGHYASFACNGERVYYDSTHGKLWAFPNFGSGNGALGMLDIDTGVISGTTGYDDRADYWQRDYEWDKPAYHFNDVVSVPDENAVFIAVENGDRIVLKYDYGTDEFTELGIPIQSIKYFDVNNSTVFGVGQASVVKYENGNWEIVSAGLASETPYGFAVKHNYAFIPAKDNMEVVHLVSGKTSIWDFDELPIKGDITSIKMRTNQHPGVLTKAYSMVIGTTKGVVICNLNLQ